MATSAPPDVPVLQAFVKNILFSATAKEVADYFSEFATVLECKLLKGDTSSCRRDGRRSVTSAGHKGSGFVTFATVGDLSLVLRTSHNFRGRTLTVKRSERAQSVLLKDDDRIFLFNEGPLQVGVWLAQSRCFLQHWIAPSNVVTVVDFQRKYVKFSFISRGKKYHIRQEMEDVFDLFCTEVPKVNDGSQKRNYLSGLTVRCESAPKLSWEDYGVRVLSGLEREQEDKLFWERNPTDEEGREVQRIIDFTPHNTFGKYSDYLLVFQRSMTEMKRMRFCRVAQTLGYSSVDSVCRLRVERLGPSSHRTMDSRRALPYRVLFQVDVLVGEGILYEELLPPTFYEILSIISEKTALMALQHLLQRDTCPIEEPVSDLQDAIRQVKSSSSADHGFGVPTEAISDPEEVTTVMIHRVLVTPLRQLSWGPELDSPNRVLRQYPGHLDRFLRVSFTDEDWHPLKDGRTDEQMEEIFSRVRSVLKNGLDVGGRHFEFLAMSSSQLREHSCWFFAPPGYLRAHDIRSEMGDFSKIRSVAKYAARMGQCFSSTVTSSSCYVLEEELESIPDIEVQTQACDRSVRRYNFTDGIGSISPEFARSVARSLPYLKARVPSAFQIRFNGCKGVVAVSEQMRGGPIKLRIRPSMNKFESDHNHLEVCKTATFMPGFLNRQIITLLTTLGVSTYAFIEKQSRMLSGLNAMLVDRQAALANIRGSCNPSPNSAAAIAAHMIEVRFHLEEPFLQGVLRARRLAQLQDLRNRSRILVEDSACLMGVIDETRTMRYGQVFLQVSDPTKWRKKPQIIQGLVAIAKNPCFHPGDIRVLEAVDVPALRHMVDCLVFPANGSRPHTDECSGSDLDGDLYFVCWDKELIPPLSQRNRPAMDYQGITPPTKMKSSNITMDDLHEFFVDYIQNDNLGQIANAHVVWADRSRGNAYSDECLQLAKLHSQAVDFPKTGVPARMSRALKPEYYPHFMMKPDKVMYQSSKVLGQLFDQVNIDYPWKTRAEFSGFSPDLDLSLIVEGYQTYLVEARKSRDKYNFELRAIMEKYGIKSESEAVTGDLLKVLKRQCRKSLSETRCQIRREVGELMRSFRKTFEEQVNMTSLDLSEKRAVRLRKASAWYYVTYSTEERKRGRKDSTTYTKREERHLLSFPWILHDDLCEIKTMS